MNKAVVVNSVKDIMCESDRLWEIITDNRNFSWRSDLLRTEVTDEEHFIEYTKNNRPTYFTVTAKKKSKLYTLDFENDAIKGKWTGRFEPLNGGGTLLKFMQEVYVKNVITRLFAAAYLKKRQRRYIADLENEAYGRRIEIK